MVKNKEVVMFNKRYMPCNELLGEFLVAQDEAWVDLVQDSYVELKRLCSKTILNVREICLLALDIITMSKTTPSCINGNEYFDMRSKIITVVFELAIFVDGLVKGEKYDISRQASVIANSSVLELNLNDN
tara:strand:- start:108 stop:497 length:390 start_codon:yes stop_codon:yes gene_type:complete